jgi:hypothetical protein
MVFVPAGAPSSLPGDASSLSPCGLEAPYGRERPRTAKTISIEEVGAQVTYQSAKSAKAKDPGNAVLAIKCTGVLRIIVSLRICKFEYCT